VSAAPVRKPPAADDRTVSPGGGLPAKPKGEEETDFTSIIDNLGD